jgi:monoamine oxidase
MLNTPVTNVVRRSDSVTVRAGDRSFDGSAAIVTVPLGVLKAGAIAFDPPLPDGHAHAVEALGFGVLSKSYFRFEQRTWKSEKDFHQFLGTDPRLQRPALVTGVQSQHDRPDVDRQREPLRP